MTGESSSSSSTSTTAITTTLVVGATGATGRHVVNQLLDRGHSVRVIVRSKERMMEALGAKDGDATFPNLYVTEATLLDMTDDDLQKHVGGCDAVVSCLGHNISFSGMYGKASKKLVTKATKKLCAAVIEDRKDSKDPADEGKEMAPAKPGKFILMGSDGVANPNGQDDVRPRKERAVISVIRALVPPHGDNEAAAAYLHDMGSTEQSTLEWCVVRPTDLIDGEVSEFNLFDKPQGSLFGGGVATRSNVAACMVDLILKDELWEEWKFKMPSLVNAASAE